MSTNRGYTLIELVVVLMLISIMAVAALPRLFQVGDFAARGARDDVLSALRYARQSSVALRRNVCVVASTTLLTLTYASAAGATQSCTAANTIIKPGNGRAYGDSTNVLPGGATLTAGWTLVFDALGRPYDSVGTLSTATRTFTVAGDSGTISVEPQTGFVH